MLGALLRLADDDIDQVIERILTDERVERIARRVTELLLDQVLEGLQQASDKAEQ